MHESPLIFRKGLDLKHEVSHLLAASYDSSLVARVKASGFRFESGRLTIHLARQFGFCYGVDRAVDYAYQARKRFPSRPIYLTGEIIHNPFVNDQLRSQGIQLLTDPGQSIEHLTSEDVVILPAFGVPLELLAQLEERGCTMVDTTCGSVLNVWKNVRRYAQDGFTSVIHGKHWHEETRATVSQVRRAGQAPYLVVLDRQQTELVCAHIRHGGDRDDFLARFEAATSESFDPDRDLRRIGCANQTTMLSSESIAIGELLRDAMRDRYGEADLATRFRAFDTICSATQDRQDAVVALLDEHRPDAVIVLGGYNSSNTCNLARICSAQVATYHVAEPDAIQADGDIRHKPVGSAGETLTAGWLPPGAVTIGLTSGASTPDSLVEDVIRRIDELANG